jgi:hypothetical protein
MSSAPALLFHGGNTGSIPVGRANKIKDLASLRKFVSQSCPSLALLLRLLERCDLDRYGSPHSGGLLDRQCVKARAELSPMPRYRSPVYSLVARFAPVSGAFHPGPAQRFATALLRLAMRARCSKGESTDCGGAPVGSRATSQWHSRRRVAETDRC